MIAIVDYGMGNLRSVHKAVEQVGSAAQVISDPQGIKNASKIILPGVGAFRDCMHNLTDRGLLEPLVTAIEAGKPFLGICLGLQLLFTQSEEFGLCEGLGIIDGTVEDFSNFISRERVPHVGWSQVNRYKSKRQQYIHTTPRTDIKDGTYFYFVHSYFVRPADKDDIYTTTRYGELEFCSSIIKDNILACQFHPEKSGRNGLRLLKQFFC